MSSIIIQNLRSSAKSITKSVPTAAAHSTSNNVAIQALLSNIGNMIPSKLWTTSTTATTTSATKTATATTTTDALDVPHNISYDDNNYHTTNKVIFKNYTFLQHPSIMDIDMDMEQQQQQSMFIYQGIMVNVNQDVHLLDVEEEEEEEEEEEAAAAAAGDTFTVTTSPTTTRTRHSPPPPPIYIHARPQSYCTQLKKRRVSVDDMGYNNDDKDYDYRSTRENLSFHAPTPVYASTSHGEQMYARNISNAFDSWSATSSSTPSLANVNSMTSTTAMTFRTPPRMNLSKQNDEGQRRQVQVKDQQQKTPKKQEDDTLCESPELMDIILHTSVESYIQGPPPLRRRETNYLF